MALHKTCSSGQPKTIIYTQTIQPVSPLTKDINVKFIEDKDTYTSLRDSSLGRGPTELSLRDWLFSRQFKVATKSETAETQA